MQPTWPENASTSLVQVDGEQGHQCNMFSLLGPAEHRPGNSIVALQLRGSGMQDSLGGNAKTMIIANVSPTFLCAHETHSTLQFAQRAKHIRNRAVINQDTNGDMVNLQREIVRLNRWVLVGVGT